MGESFPLPGKTVTSIDSSSPPPSVQANPVATPTGSGLLAGKRWYLGIPKNSLRSSTPTLVEYYFPLSTTFLAILRQMVAISRSKLRTPDSRV